MTIDVEALLRRVVVDVFDPDVEAVWSIEPKSPHVHRVRLTSADGERHAGLRASYEWFDVTVFDLGVSHGSYDYDDDEEAKAAELRPLARIARAYLRGDGHIKYRRGLLRQRPVLVLRVDDVEWELGRRSSRSRPLT